MYVTSTFFRQKNPNFQLQQLLSLLCHVFLIYIGYFMLIFEAEDMASFLANQNLQFWSPSKTCINEAKFLERKEAQVFTNIGTTGILEK